MKRKNQLNKVWVRIVGLPLHLWTCDVLRMIGDGCGGYLATDEETIHRTEVLLWARILVKAEGRERLSTVNIISGSRSYKLQIWWELPPWVAGVFPSKGADTGMQNQEEDEWSSRAVQGACSGRKQGIDDDLKRLSAVGNGKSVLGLVDLTKGAGRTAARVPRMGSDPIGEGYRSKGLGSIGGRIRLVSGLEEVSDALSPSAHQLKSKVKCILNGSGPMAHVLGPGRLEEDGSSFNLITRAPVSLPYNRRGGKERVLALSNTGDEFVELRYDQSQSRPSTSSPSVSYRLLPSGEFFGQEGGCEKFGGGDCGGCGQIPLKVMLPTCSPRCSDREMVVVEEHQMTQSTGGEKVEEGGGGGGGWCGEGVENDIAPWEESCLAKFSEFLRFPT